MPIDRDQVVAKLTARNVTSLLQWESPAHGTGRGAPVPGQRQDGVFGGVPWHG
jgi:hypothetical protein